MFASTVYTYIVLSGPRNVSKCPKILSFFIRIIFLHFYPYAGSEDRTNLTVSWSAAFFLSAFKVFQTVLAHKKGGGWSKQALGMTQAWVVIQN